MLQGKFAFEQGIIAASYEDRPQQSLEGRSISLSSAISAR
jgi:hypothetical protein